MNSHQLETFIRVADCGSFNRAAAEAYITPTAVVKQINLLESYLEVKLFDRTHKGLTLTNAGRSFYKDAKYILKYYRDSVERAKSAVVGETDVIRIGVSPMTPARIFLDLSPKLYEICPEIKTRLIPFENTPENAKEILDNLGRDIDVVAGVFDEATFGLKKCKGLQISEEILCCAVSMRHPLASKDRLSIQDLYGENLMLIHRGWSQQIDRLRDDIQANHEQINIIDFDFYDVFLLNRCEQSNNFLLMVDPWTDVHPLLKIIPVDWGYTIPYGLLHSIEPTETVQKFLNAVKKAIE